MNVSTITREMTPHMLKADAWRPNNPTIPCGDLPCDPPYAPDRKPTAPHSHAAVRMLVPIYVSASVSIGRTRVVI